MRSFCLVLLAFVVGAGAAGCGDDDPFNFNGRWSFAQRVGSQQGDWAPWSGEVTIEQNGNFITVLFPGQLPAEGLCDPDDGTFTAQLYTRGGQRSCSYVGRSDGDDALNGTASCYSGDGGRAIYNWTAALISR